MRFLNDDVIYYWKKAVQTYLALRGKRGNYIFQLNEIILLLNHERTLINQIILESWVKFH